MDDKRAPGQRLHHFLIPLLEIIDVLRRSLRDLSVVVEVEADDMTESFWHFEHARNGS